jgi:hypothetical protein
MAVNWNREYRRTRGITNIEQVDPHPVRIIGTCMVLKYYSQISLRSFPNRRFEIKPNDVVLALSHPTSEHCIVLYIGVTGKYSGWYITRRGTNSLGEPTVAPQVITGHITARGMYFGHRMCLVDITSIPQKGSSLEREPMWFADELFHVEDDDIFVLSL